MDYEDNKQSRFNAGVALAERIDGLQKALNAARYNPLLQNQETQTFNFEIMVESNNGLLNESWAKLNDTEKKMGQRLRKVARDFIKHYPIIRVSKDGSFEINKNNYSKFMELMDFYEKKNKEFLDAHSLNSPNSDDDDGL